MELPLDIPALVRQRAEANGVAGRRWLDELPEMVAALAGRWGLRVGESFRGGTASYVVAAVDRSDRPCALKVGMPADMDEDDEGLRSEPEHDLSVAMREYNRPLLAGDTPRLVRERAELLASRCGVDAQAVWEWGFIERVSTGLANLRNFEGDNGSAFLEVAKRCV
jgi:hypothetical protein